MNCPACGTSINADFGMISCPQCAAVFMVEMDGTIQLQTEEILEEAPPMDESAFEESPGEVSYSAPALDSEEAEAAYFEENPDQQIDTSTNQIVEEPMDEDTVMYTPMENEVSGIVEANDYALDENPQEDSESAETVATDYSEDFMDSMNAPAEPKPINPQDPLGVTAFDQAEASQLTEGLYYYDLKISGLDSAELRENVIDALSDPRFDWLPEELKRNISGGELVLRSLNPIKAVLAVIKVQALDVAVEWDQKLYTDESVQDGQEAET